MKNTKKIISLVLAICMLASLAISASAANTVDASGGTGTSSVTLSSTADGSLDGDPSATKMSVVVPTVLPIAVGTDGSVATASDAKIINNSYGAVKVNSVSIEAAQGWSLAAFGSKDTLAHEKVNSNKFGFQLAIGGGAAAATDNKNASKQTLLDTAIEGCYMSGVGDTSANSIGITYDAIVTPVSEAVTNAIVHAYTEKSGKVILRAWIDEDAIRIKVEDMGRGIENIEQAMQPFYTTQPDQERTGMGFALMQSFMDSVRVQSSPGNGTLVFMQKRLHENDE